MQISHIKVCLQVLGSITAYEQKKLYHIVASEGAVKSNRLPQVMSLESVSAEAEDYKFEN